MRLPAVRCPVLRGGTGARRRSACDLSALQLPPLWRAGRISAGAVITAIFTAPESARRFAVASRCDAPRHAINARAAERVVMRLGSVVGALTNSTQ
jgi:hypothetical protein